MTFLDVQAVDKRYGTVLALDQVSLQVAAGTRTAILGPSGSGKTTLLRMIAGFESPDAGKILLDGELMADGASAVLAHRRGIGFVSQDGALFPHLSVAGNIGFGLPRSSADRDARVAELTAMVELPADILVRRPHQLSGGQQQRVALARALARKPKLMLLDEPFSALDAGLRATVRKTTMSVLDAAGIASVLVTHDQSEALSFAHQVGIMRNGRLVQIGPPQLVYLHPRDEATAAMLGPAIVLPANADNGRADCVLGSLALPAGSRPGRCRIMLRPEQVRLVTPAGDAAGVVADVVASEFCGASGVVTINIAHESGAWPPASIAIPVPGGELPPVNSRVVVVIAGPVHQFDE